MTSRAEEWDDRYRQGTKCPSPEPAAILREVLPLLSPGRALDIAMGSGANAIFLASHGWQVTGIDFSRAALEQAEALARQHRLPVSWAESSAPGEVQLPSAGILLIYADLEKSFLPAARFDLIVCVRYLQRSLFPGIERCLRPGGLLVFETHTLDQLRFANGPRNPDHLLRAGELQSAFPNLDTLFYREYCAGKAMATLVARAKTKGQ